MVRFQIQMSSDTSLPASAHCPPINVSPRRIQWGCCNYSPRDRYAQPIPVLLSRQPCSLGRRIVLCSRSYIPMRKLALRNPPLFICRWLLIAVVAILVIFGVALGVFYGVYSGSKAPKYGEFTDVAALESSGLESHKVCRYLVSSLNGNPHFTAHRHANGP